MERKDGGVKTPIFLNTNKGVRREVRIIVDGNVGTLSLWDDDPRPCLVKEDGVYELDPGTDNFSIAMREGGFLNICCLEIESWTEQPVYDWVYNDKGDRTKKDNLSELLKGYFFKDQIGA